VISQKCVNLEEIELIDCSEISGNAVRDLILACKKIRVVKIERCKKVTKKQLLKSFDDRKLKLYFNTKRVL
jgi:hypothetical protein